MTSGGEWKAPARWIYEAPGFRRELATAGLEQLAALSTRDLGEVVTDHRSSWVRRVSMGLREIYIKTYDYPTWTDRGRGLARNTALARSRPHREQAALCWLLDHGFPGPEPLVVLESRRLGFLRRAVLVTAAWPGQPADQVLAGLPPGDQRKLVAAVTAFLYRLHEAGFRDGNMDLRNLLARQELDGWTLAKIDSPRHRLVAPGAASDRRARQDRERLRRSLRSAGLPDLATAVRSG